MAQDADPEEDSEADGAAGGRDSPLLSQLSARSTRVAARHSWAEDGANEAGRRKRGQSHSWAWPGARRSAAPPAISLCGRSGAAVSAFPGSHPSSRPSGGVRAAERRFRDKTGPRGQIGGIRTPEWAADGRKRPGPYLDPHQRTGTYAGALVAKTGGRGRMPGNTIAWRKSDVILGAPVG